MATLTEQRRQIEAEIDSLRADYDETNKTIRNLKAAIARKHQEFDELLAARIKLEAEVKRYETMISAEEFRVGIQSK